MVEKETNSFIEFEEETNLSDKDIFTLIWSSPRKVFEYIYKNKYDKYLVVLLFFSGIVKTFDRASQKNMGDQMELWSVIAISVFAGGLLGWISMYIYAALVNWSGSWLDGKGDTKSILLVFSYAMIPSILSLIAIFFQILLVDNAIFQSQDFPELDVFTTILFYGSFIAELILGIWSVYLFVIGISVVQKLSIGKAILNLLLPILVIIIPILLFVLIVKS